MRGLLLVAVYLLSCADSAPPSLVVKSQGSRVERRQAQFSSKDVKITSLRVQSNIQFRYSRTVVESYIKNYGVEAQTTEFRTILPNSAFISNFSMIIKDVEYVAEVKEKAQARSDFNQQVGQGSGAGLVEQDSRNANLVVISANVEPGEKVLFKLTYDELLERQLGQYEHVIHVNPGQVVEDFNILVNINESLPIISLSVPELKKSNELDFTKTESTIAEIKRSVDNDPAKASIEFKITKDYQEKEGSDGVKGEFSVLYDVDRKNQTNEIQVIDGYFVHFFVPENLKVLPKHVIFVLDVSGSMYGEKLQQLKDAMFTILDEMTDADHFDIITFSSEVTTWNPPTAEKTALKASKENKNIGINFILKLEARGGTNINDAMTKAVELGKTIKREELLKKEVQTMILFLTDGVPTEGETSKPNILSNIKSSNTDGQFPIFALAFGRDADFDLMVKVSEDAGSRAKQIYEGSDAALQLEGFYQEISSPLLSDISFKYVGNAVVEDSVTKTEQKTYFKGTEYIVAGKIAQNTESSSFVISTEGAAGDQLYSEELTVCFRNLPTHQDQILPLPNPFPPTCFEPPPPPPRSDAQNFIKSLYAFLNIKQLLRTGPAGKEKALNMSLENNFVTELTSLIVKKENNEEETAIIKDASQEVQELQYFSTRRWSGPPGPVPMLGFGSGGYQGAFGYSSPQIHRKRVPISSLTTMDYQSSFGVTFQSDYEEEEEEKDYSLNSSPYTTSISPTMFFTGLSTTTTTTSTSTTTSSICQLSLFSKTYNRGDSVQLTETTADLEDYNNLAVTASLAGTCCWVLYSQTNLTGQQVTLHPARDYTNVSSLGNLLRNIKSVEKVTC